MSLENSLRTECLASGKVLLKVTIADMTQAKWPMMFIHVSTPTISVCSIAITFFLFAHLI